MEVYTDHNICYHDINKQYMMEANQLSHVNTDVYA